MSLSHDETRARLAKAEEDIVVKTLDLEAAQAKVLELQTVLEDAVTRLAKAEADIVKITPVVFVEPIKP